VERLGPGNSDWIGLHLSFALSDRERNLREQKESISPPVLVEVKDSLHAFFVRASEPKAKRIFGLSAPSCGIYAVIFLNHLRLDLASHTLIADTCVLPLTLERVNSLGESIANITGNEKMMTINTSEQEASVWKQLFPVLVERCRTWSHTLNCQYLEQRNIPLSVELDQNPICGCGEGRDLGAFSKVSGWKRLAPYVTRAVFSPFFAVPYMESVCGFLKDMPDSDAAVDSGVGGSTCAHCGIAGQQKLLKCSRCQKTSYCGQTCQRADWKQHKKYCKPKQ
jgi:hypothetical protein